MHRRNPAIGLVTLLVWLWRSILGPLINMMSGSGGGRVCRFDPTCSEYMREAVTSYGFWRGGWMGLKRVFRCHPFGGSGYDPVP
ncbi:MAG: membrane protein insertion efficiency factor YidD [Candidatus Pacebacteria bacterium]|nr:membrane protein insertion efficiency factor YidD [Candidatus Paceibacterota bacterium]